MAVYVVTWNLNRERSNYGKAREEFLGQLNRYENKADSALETVRWVSTTNSASQVDETLRQKLDKNDRLFVSKLNPGERAGWLENDVWEWINARV